MVGEPVLIMLVEDNPDHAELVMRTMADHRVANQIIHFMDGINFIPLGVGFFAITDILINVEEGLEFKVSDEGRAKARGRKAWSYIGEIIQ